MALDTEGRDAPDRSRGVAPKRFRLAAIGDGADLERRLAAAGADAVGRLSEHDLEAARAGYDAAVLGAATPGKMALAERLLRAGKHVLIEPPLLSADDAAYARLQSLSRANKRFALVAYGHRFEAPFQAIKDALDADAFGRVYRCRLFSARAHGVFVADAQRSAGRRALLEELGPRVFDTARYWFGPLIDEATPSDLRAIDEQAEHISLTTGRARPRLELEMSSQPSRTHFTADIFAAAGSAHVTSFSRWGGAATVIRVRILRTGAEPIETVTMLRREDVLVAEHLCFRQLAVDGATANLETDRTLNRTLRSAANAHKPRKRRAHAA